MHCFDFLSDSPKVSIFQKARNKTNFGGVLFLIYIIIMILISVAYILDYINNEKFSYEALTFYNNTNNEEEKININKDDELNPYLNFTLSITSRYKDKLVVHDINNDIYLEKDNMDIYGRSYFNLRRKITDIDLGIYYICAEEKNCSSYYQYFDGFYDNIEFGTTIIKYAGYEINHAKDPPVEISEEKPIITENILTFPNILGFGFRTYEWEVIKYKDQRSLFDSLTKRKTEYIFGHLKNDIIEFSKYDNYTKYVNYDFRVGYILPVFEIYFLNEHKEYLFYKRKKVELLDVLANIGALFSTIRYIFSFFFSFYSKNFDNYKIIWNILNYQNKQIKIIELNSNINLSTSLGKRTDKNIIRDINNLEPLIEETPNKSKISLKYSDINNDIDDEDISESSSIILNKLHFYDYLFNNIYSKCCKKNKKQEIINTINNIINKFLSVDYLLYNQIKLENLFKDYKWNNPELNKIQNNKMIMKLKNS